MLARRKRILVTGGAGCLDSYVCEQLVSAGNEVLCADKFYNDAKENLAGLLTCPQFEMIRHDVTFPPYLEVDEIFNPIPRYPTSRWPGKRWDGLDRSRCGMDWRRALRIPGPR